MACTAQPQFSDPHYRMKGYYQGLMIWNTSKEASLFHPFSIRTINSALFNSSVLHLSPQKWTTNRVIAHRTCFRGCSEANKSFSQRVQTESEIAAHACL
ncbi:hypothetical protein IMY05_006G0002000 [Salix suchowensis]|nr:hypothetical protein IMY05_006G0002000 [Salix suchowensis]